MTAYVSFGVLAVLSIAALFYCLAAISPWAVGAAVAYMAFHVFTRLQNEAWGVYKRK